MEGYIFWTLMSTCIVHEEQKLKSAGSRGSAELRTQPGSCCQGRMAAWAGDVAAQQLAAASRRGCQQHSSARGCEHPLSADFGGGREQLCASLMAAEAPPTAVLQRMLVPELLLAWVCNGFAFCSLFFFPCV